MAKKIISVVLLASLLILSLGACDDYLLPTATTSGTITDHLSTLEHVGVANDVLTASKDMSYFDLFCVYQDAISHKEAYGCDLDLKQLMTYMLYGKWEDNSRYYIEYTYVYEDYENQYGEEWLGTNLPSSKIDGNKYYYYIDTLDEKLIISYQDKITKEKTENFTIKFYANSIVLYNKTNNTNYELKRDVTFDHEVKDNARTAFIYFAKTISTFKAPETVKVKECHVDQNSKSAYAVIKYLNEYGVEVTADYKLYESDGKYYITEYEHTYSTNIKVDELNEKIQSFIATGE